MSEYFGWVAYFKEINSNEDQKPNLLKDDGGQSMLQGFGL